MMSEIELGTPRLLVVDDHAPSRYATVRMLRAAGFETEEVATGRDALARVSSDIDLVVLDINLPDIDGFQVCRELRARRETVDLPICYLSATFTNEEDIARGMSTGADSYLTHPADPVVLVATIRALLFVRDAHVQRRIADARFRAVFDMAPNGLAALDTDLGFTDVNPALCKLLNRPREAIIGQPLRNLVADEDRTKLDGLYEALRLERSWSAILRLPRGSSEDTAETEWQVTQDVGTGAIIAIISDITLRRLLEAARERALAGEQAARTQAERSNQLKDEFLAVLSHELRNPLNAILNWTDVLKRTPGMAAEMAKGIEAIGRNSRVQLHLISDLLDFAGIRFGKMRLERQRVDPKRALRAALDIMKGQAQSKGVHIEATLPAGDVVVLGDEARLQQVFWNLLTNAIKFTPSGGRVDVIASETDREFEVEVRDTGSGISPEFVPRLFDRFSQQDSGNVKQFSGLGIGLTIVRHLVTMHGGTITVHSEGVGCGASFTVRLPRADGADRSAADEQSLTDVRVLVVEDMSDTRALVARLLRDAGAKVREAASAEEALEAISSDKPDVLVSDIGMPGTDGYQLLRTLRRQGYSPDRLPALALTAFQRTEDRSDALEAGFQLYLTKPVDPAVLISAVLNLHGSPARRAHATTRRP
jgi:PAS domain S-box-containing protein